MYDRKRMNILKRVTAAVVLAAMLTGCGAAGGTQPEQKPETAEPAEQTEETKPEETKPEETKPEETEAAEQTDETADKDGAESGEKQEETKEAEKTEEAEQDNGKQVNKYGYEYAVLPDNEAIAFAQSLGAGYNLGNTFDAYNDTGLKKDMSDELSTETCWQHVETTQATIQGIADAGFGSIRIPVSWHNHITDDNYTISEAWMDRVNTVVDWALDAGLKVIINIHHDNHLEANGLYPDQEHLEQSKKYVGRIWEQVAERFKDYDDNLIFEAMNEPRLVGNEKYEWSFNGADKECRASVECINELNQLFLDTVRSVDGPHRTCYVLCPGYGGSPDGALANNFVLPTDAEDVENRIMVEVHSYTPYDFALNKSGTKEFDPEKAGDTGDITGFIKKLYSKYVAQGIPVVIDEFGAMDKGGNLEARTDHAAFFTSFAWSRGMPCFWWDNGAFSGDGEIFGIYDREACEWKYPEIRDAILENAVPAQK